LRKIVRIFAFNLWSDSGATFSRGCLCLVIEYPRNFRSQGRATALFPAFTFSRRRSVRYLVTVFITRSPAAFDLT
jgi:hypothetical protein